MSVTGAVVTLAPDLVYVLAENALVNEALDDRADRILAVALTLVPVRTGKLKATGRVEDTPEGKRVVFGGGEVDYAGYVEFGTEDTPTFAYLRRAADAVMGPSKISRVSGIFRSIASFFFRGRK
jgi:hypothetical protein